MTRDVDGGKKALGRLHKLGIKLVDIDKDNLLVRDRYAMGLVDFEMTKRYCSPPKLTDERSALQSLAFQKPVIVQLASRTAIFGQPTQDLSQESQELLLFLTIQFRLTALKRLAWNGG